MAFDGDEFKLEIQWYFACEGISVGFTGTDINSTEVNELGQYFSETSAAEYGISMDGHQEILSFGVDLEYFIVVAVFSWDEVQFDSLAHTRRKNPLLIHFD